MSWQNIKFANMIIKTIGGGTPSTKKDSFWNGDIPWMTSAHISNKNIYNGQRYISERGLESSASNLIPKNNLLIATRVGIGKVAINKVDIAISQDLTGFILDETKVFVDFIYYWVLNNSNKLKSLAQGSTIKGILKDDINRISVDLPPYKEQTAIANILSTVDEAIQKADEAIKKTERIKQAVMQKLLTEGIGHKEFKQTNIGQIPKGWDIVNLNKICKIKRETYEPQKDGNLVFVGLEHITPSAFYLDKYGLESDVRSSKTKFSDGDILYGKLRPYLDKVAITRVQGICSTDILVVTPQQQKAISGFILFLLHSKRFINFSVSRMSGTNHPRVSWKEISKFTIGLPPVEEQNRIALIIFSIQQKLELEIKRKEILERIKQGLMDDLLTGKKRVKI